MKLFEELLGLKLIESLTESPDWESTWWDTVYRGLQEDFSAEGRPVGELPAQTAQRTAASSHSAN